MGILNMEQFLKNRQNVFELKVKALVLTEKEFIDGIPAKIIERAKAKAYEDDELPLESESGIKEALENSGEKSDDTDFDPPKAKTARFDDSSLGEKKKEIEDTEMDTLQKQPDILEQYRQHRSKYEIYTGKGITNPVLPIVNKEGITVPERPKVYVDPVYSTPESPQEKEIYSRNDIAVVRLEDLAEKISCLNTDIKMYELNVEERTPQVYRRLEELCVKYAINLDQINVVGRNTLRNVRRQMIIYLDRLSTDIVATVTN